MRSKWRRNTFGRLESDTPQIPQLIHATHSYVHTAVVKATCVKSVYVYFAITIRNKRVSKHIYVCLKTQYNSKKSNQFNTFKRRSAWLRASDDELLCFAWILIYASRWVYRSECSFYTHTTTNLTIQWVSVVLVVFSEWTQVISVDFFRDQLPFKLT